jgi:hypothetical protein
MFVEINVISMNFFWSKTYTHTCPDGSTRIIHRNIDKAFPLHIQTADHKTNFDFKGIKGLKGKLSRDYKSKIEGVLFELNDLNSSLMMKFRSAYVLLQTNPCGGYEIFSNEILKINNEHHDMLVLRTKIKGLIDLAGDNKVQALELYNGIVKLIDDFKAPATASLEIEFIRGLMQKETQTV